ncbi:MAG TPA: GH1 family beta-glucosidase [Ornithinimicrobium sp.]|uniref:GH1 family beta-glucosidase n=1 Tax=Ornithinimicrobium sp. TaxID=1977084 RepID=UPI002B49E107|nr:GH1 family beta-glucosidase [Ornithinimicrobium sp.]HKJ12127.1 GH1 family beta-glucosidase [Ornithinimicrobium sp.]
MARSTAFPAGFLWGSATAAYQIEGASHTDGRTDSIWDTFARVPGAVYEGHDGSVACDHYHRYGEDVELMRQIGLGAYRFSVSWARVCPDGGGVNQAGLDFYSRLVDALLEADIVPWLTLYHWDLPQALEESGGWPARQTAERFVEYTGVVHDALGDRVKFWTTMNEPWCSAFLGYGSGVHAPGRTDGADALRAAHHLMLAHGLAVRELRDRDSSLDLGLTLNFADVEAASDSAGDQDAERRMDGLMNRYFLEPIINGAYPRDVMQDVSEVMPEDLIQDGDLDVISTPIDVLGVNYYFGQAVSGVEPEEAAQAAADARQRGPSANVGSEHVEVVSRGLPVTDMGWEVVPDGLRRLLVRLDNHVTGPVGTGLYVTENGAAYPDEPDEDDFVDDQDRIAYLRAHLEALHEAVESGVDVRGYFLWSLMDNYEWAFGYSKRFGMVRIDYESGTRTPKASATWYGHVASHGELPD